MKIDKIALIACYIVIFPLQSEANEIHILFFLIVKCLVIQRKREKRF
ncbi:hypothetical protein PRABACTJOHN_00880 [Parabacteroides johnsonii DSM 18315]|uniref:Uncharacterized protein n=1 Tax=Parabacteroides johnsonii DSM 18315 TaxID=537006 RepID=B7B783_9BACT|nr:hypothetical protein PRABACTJOHN_00880 [Parabacteroides johnsonii DSM 18315]